MTPRESHSSEVTYRAWDREEKLGPPPWSPEDPKLIAWEAAHGHDVRLKCYPEFGCQYAENDRVVELEQAIEDYMLWQPGRRGHAAAHKRLASVLREGQER